MHRSTRPLLLGLLLLGLGWLLWPEPASHIPSAPETPTAEAKGAEPERPIAQRIITPRPSTPATTEPRPQQRTDRVQLISSVGLPIERVLQLHDGNRTSIHRLKTPGWIDLGRFPDEPFLLPVGHMPFDWEDPSPIQTFEPAFELRVTGLPREVLRNADDVKVVTEFGSWDPNEVLHSDWFFEQGCVDEDWILAISPFGDPISGSNLTDIQFPSSAKVRQLQLRAEEWYEQKISIPWFAMVDSHPQTTFQEFHVDPGGLLHRNMTWDFLYTSADGAAPLTEVIAQGDWGSIYGFLDAKIQRQEYGNSMVLEGIPVGVQVTALATCSCGHYASFPAALAGKAERTAVSSTRPTFSGMVSMIGAVAAEEPISYSLTWHGETPLNRYDQPTRPLDLREDGSFHHEIPLFVEDVAHWNHDGMMAPLANLTVGSPFSVSTHKETGMDWEGEVSFGLLELIRLKPLFLIQGEQKGMGTSYQFEYMPGFDATLSGRQSERSFNDLHCDSIVRNEDHWEVYTFRRDKVPADFDYLTWRNEPPVYLKSSGSQTFEPMRAEAYKLQFSTAFLERHPNATGQAWFGGVPIQGSERDLREGMLPMRFYAPGEAVSLAVENPDDEGHVVIYPLKAGEQVLK